MAEIAPRMTEEQKQKLLAEWFSAGELLDQVKDREAELRAKVWDQFFVTYDELGQKKLPKEGMNKAELKDGYVLNGERKINRSVNEAAYRALMSEKAQYEVRVAGGEVLVEQEAARFAMLKMVRLEMLVKYKPELAVREYRTLTKEEEELFNEVLVIKDGTPQLEIVKPKRK